MNPLNVIAFFAFVACTSASVISWAPASGSVGVSVDGAVIAGPSGSVRTDNGLKGWGAAAQLSGPAGDVRTRGGSVQLDGPGVDGIEKVGVVAPAVWSAPQIVPQVITTKVVAAPVISRVVAAPTIVAGPVAKLGLGVGGLGLGWGVNNVGLGGW